MTKEFIVILDAGHGSWKDKIKKIYSTAGKRTPDGEPEWEFNNKVLLACEEELNKYENVKIVRLDDPTGKTDVPLNTRCNTANKYNGDVLVSIHANAYESQWGTHGGTETFVYTNPSSSDTKLATAVHGRMAATTELRNRGIKKGNLQMIRVPKTNAKILVETGFMDSTIDIKYLRNDNKLKETGIAIAKGIAEYGNLKLKQNSPVKPTPPITNQGGSRKLNLQQWQKNEIAQIYKKLQDKDRKIFTTDWSTKMKKGEVTVDEAIYLLHAMIDRTVLK